MRANRKHHSDSQWDILPGFLGYHRLYGFQKIFSNG
ncbi:hypothetical protein T06_14019 [Trichinella sp. T6]|nr:hypothetical protein T06_14019 [Trichinella sp. T6]